MDTTENTTTTRETKPRVLTRMEKNIQRIKDFIREHGGTFKIKVFRVPNVTNAKDEGVKEHVIFNLRLVVTGDGNILPTATGTTFETDEIMTDVGQLIALPKTGYYARIAKGYTLVRIETPEGVFLGQAICSANDQFNGNIGVAAALADAMRSAGRSNTEFGREWRGYLKSLRKPVAA